MLTSWVIKSVQSGQLATAVIFYINSWALLTDMEHPSSNTKLEGSHTYLDNQAHFSYVTVL